MPLESRSEGARDAVHAVDRDARRIRARVVPAEDELDLVAGVLDAEPSAVAERILQELEALGTEHRRQRLPDGPVGDRAAQVGGRRPHLPPIGVSHGVKAGNEPLEGFCGQVIGRAAALGRGQVVPGTGLWIRVAVAEPATEEGALRPAARVEGSRRDAELPHDAVDDWVARQIAHAPELDRLGDIADLHRPQPAADTVRPFEQPDRPVGSRPREAIREVRARGSRADDRNVEDVCVRPHAHASLLTARTIDPRRPPSTCATRRAPESGARRCSRRRRGSSRRRRSGAPARHGFRVP